MLTPSQRRCFQKGSEACDSVCTSLGWLKEVAKVAPEFADQIKELEEMHEHHSQLCAAALAADAGG